MHMVREDSGDKPAMDSSTSPPLETAVHRILQPAAWPRPKGYSNGVLAEGQVIVTGGVVGWNQDGVFPPTFVGQARQAFENIVTILGEGNAKPEHLIRLTWYVTDIEEYLASPQELGAAYREVFGRSYPAMAAVQVMRLVEPAAKIEIEATAVLPVERSRV